MQSHLRDFREVEVLPFNAVFVPVGNLQIPLHTLLLIVKSDFDAFTGRERVPPQHVSSPFVRTVVRNVKLVNLDACLVMQNKILLSPTGKPRRRETHSDNAQAIKTLDLEMISFMSIIPFLPI